MRIKINPRKIWIFLFVGIFVAWLDYLFVYNKMGHLFLPQPPNVACVDKSDKEISRAIELLKKRKDKEALVIFEAILKKQPESPDALWGKAEILRRLHKYNDAEIILTQVLNKNPWHASALVTAAYIRYKYDELKEAAGLIRRVINSNNPDRENLALAYTMLGAINSKRFSKGGLFNKLTYGMQIKGYLLKAKNLAPDMAEVRVGLGTFYTLAPSFAGGNIDRACVELEYAVEIAPNFATANARLAQAYRKKGLEDKYRFYLNRARSLDPENEVVKELEK